MKLDDVLKHYLMDVDNRLGDLTFVNYTQRLGVLVRLLNDLCGVTELEQVTVLHLRECVQHLLTVPVEWTHLHGRKPEDGEKLASSTVRSYVRVWKAFFSWCYQEELIGVNPAVRLKSPKVPKRVRPAFVADQIERMLAACDVSTPLGFRDRVIVLLLLDTGVRKSEIGGLRVSDVHERHIKVMGKGRKEREIGVYPEMSKLLWKYIYKYRKPCDPDEQALFIRRDGKPLSSAGVHSVMKRVQKTAGLEDIKFSAHVFRHTFSKMYLERGGDLFDLSRELGHSNINTTKIYLEDYGSSEARKHHDAFSPLAGIDLKKGKRSYRGKGAVEKKRI
jgi:integrase/recombinase XerD